MDTLQGQSKSKRERERSQPMECNGDTHMFVAPALAVVAMAGGCAFEPLDAVLSRAVVVPVPTLAPAPARLCRLRGTSPTVGRLDVIAVAGAASGAVADRVVEDVVVVVVVATGTRNRVKARSPGKPPPPDTTDAGA
jgi:hypothetical protein